MYVPSAVSTWLLTKQKNNNFVELVTLIQTSISGEVILYFYVTRIRVIFTNLLPKGALLVMDQCHCGILCRLESSIDVFSKSCP